ncbi:MAG: hypothetical protein ACOZF0_20470 [Thermodesulfobacteriota bacterium]
MKITSFFLLLACFACTGARVDSAEGLREQTISVAVVAPDSAWKIRIETIRRVEDALLVVSRLSRGNVRATQTITVVSDRVRVKAPELAVRHYIVGKTWEWRNSEPYTFLKSPDEVAGIRNAGVPLYP